MTTPELTTMASAVLKQLRLLRQYLAAREGSAINVGKRLPSGGLTTHLNTALTYFDTFIQDILIVHCNSVLPGAEFIVEEDTPIFDVVRQGQISTTWSVLIDPIDYTHGFTNADFRYSILLGVCRTGEMKLALGYYPSTDTAFIASEDEHCQVFSGNEGAMPCRLVEKTRRAVAAHYRLAMHEYTPAYNAILGSGFDVHFNGKGFGTNLDAAVGIIDGTYSAFVAPYINAIDGLSPAYIASKAGAWVQFYDASASPQTWTRIDQRWLNAAKNTPEGRRCRLIAARDQDTIDELERILMAVRCGP